ncbi:MAG: hypothetical protein AMXMBFR66_16700 [Pseudomonadota bacterium]|nr:hypothetical protein [Rubrivivax sp.]
MVLRWLMLLAAAGLMVLASGAAGGEEQPSALRLAAAAAVGVLAPLFWPGRAASGARTLARIAAWSLAAAAAAALLARLLGRLPQPAAALLASSAMLLLMLWPAHAALALLERHWPRPAAGSALATMLLLAGMAPLVAGPAAELLERSHPGAIDAVVAASPLTHLALAGGNDLLRNEWFYRHANLAALQFSYPELPALLAAYAGAAVVLSAAIVLMPWHQAPRADTAPYPEKEP